MGAAVLVVNLSVLQFRARLAGLNMHILSGNRRMAVRLTAACLIAACLLTPPALADPVAAPGDLRLRHDLQLLGDAGLLNIPLTTWPVPWGDISNALADKNKVHNSALRASWQRVHQRMDNEFSSRVKLSSRLAAVALPSRFRTFTDTPRSSAEAGMTASMTGNYLAVHLEGTAAVRKPRDRKHWRPDGSYAAVSLGNWIVSAGWQDRWWGPAWEGSLIMSTNARPLPAISILRNASEAFDMPVLRWLGPWQFRMFQARLEGNRSIPNALLTGMRLSFKPTPSLEIGFSRGIQWGGAGRPQNLATFLRALAGRDNVGQKGITRANQPGNQLAGYDMRWVSPLFDLPYAVYTQWIGEDESRGFPISYMAIIGGEIWGTWGDAGASWRLHMEYADTAAHLFSGSLSNRNVAYEHGVYRSGYRYYNQSLGHSIDGDGLSFSLGGVLVDSAGRSWEMVFRQIRSNRDGISPGVVKIPAEHILAVEGRGTFDTDFGQFQIGASLYRSRLNASPNVSYRASAEFQWQVHY